MSKTLHEDLGQLVTDLIKSGKQVTAYDLGEAAGIPRAEAKAFLADFRITPEVGMGATICYATDRYPATVVAVSKSGKQVTVQEDSFFRTDDNGMSDCQSYDYERNPNGTLATYTLRRNGSWIERGVGTKEAGKCLTIGHRRRYYDYSF